MVFSSITFLVYFLPLFLLAYHLTPNKFKNACLEEKGLVQSQLGEATKTRGGKRKRFYQLTMAGKSALVRAKSMRDQLWDKIRSLV